LPCDGGHELPEIAQKGGGIWSTVSKTRETKVEELAELTAVRAERLLHLGTTTAEVKSGYGLNADSERKILMAIHKAHELTRADLVPTCLAAHIKPRDFEGSAKEYLDYLIRELLPMIRAEQLCYRVDVYVDEGAFSHRMPVQFASA
jgi:imidazolonepropionase